MRKFIIALMILAAMITAVVLVGCSNGDGQEVTSDEGVTTVADSIETTSAVGDETKDESATTGETVTEDVTEMPRFDYFGNSMDEYIRLKTDDYAKFVVEVDKQYRVDDEAVKDYIDVMRVRNAKPVEEMTDLADVAIEYGDLVKLYFKGYVDGEAFSGGAYTPDEHDEPTELVIGSKTFVPGFEESMIGMIPNETVKDIENSKKITVTFPKDYGGELAGKQADFYLYIVSTTRQTVPEYNKEFITETLKYTPEREAYAEGELEAEFNKEIADYMTESFASKVENIKAEAIWKQLRDAAEVIKIPEEETDYYYNSYYNSIKSNYEYANQYYLSSMGYSPYESIDDFAIESLGLNKGADWKKELADRGYEMTLENLIYHYIAEKEGIENISDEEYKSELEYWVETYKQTGYSAEEIEKNLGKEYICESALYKKIMQLLDGKVEIIYS